MDNTFKAVKAKVRSLVGDPMADWTTDAYLNPLVNIIYEDQTTQLMADADSSFDDWEFECLSVPIGTTSLGTYQQMTMTTISPIDGSQVESTGPLAGLVSPSIVEWKQAGQPVGCYVEAWRTGKLPNISPALPSGIYQMSWEWMHNIINLTPVMYPVDIRVRGEFSPPTLVKDTDALVVHPRMGTATAYGTAAVAGEERNNANYAEGYLSRAQSVLDNISNMLTKSEQGVTTRIGRYGGRGGGGYNRGQGS